MPAIKTKAADRSSGHVSRREAMALSTLAVLHPSWSPFTAPAAGHAQEVAGAALPPLNRFPRMVQEYFVDLVRQAERRGDQRRAALRTQADAEAYVRDVQQRIRQCFGPEPERTPLRPRVTGVLDRGAYRIEKVIFESRPDFPVTANLYVPQGRTLPLPGVVGSCGHSANGKAAGAYQSFSQGLARRGYVVLIFDPIGQGERLQYTDEHLKPRRGIGVSEHLHAGNQQFLVGETLSGWRAWDGIRALDYLLTREEVDPRHVGITGNSGGGTMTTWLCGLESRWTMAAPSCFVTTFRRNMENELPADTEQCPPQALALDLDHSDFLAAMAPKPVIILAKERDFFDVRGSQEAFGRLKHLYTLLGKPENVQLFIGPSDHGYSQENREAMYGWFDRATGKEADPREPALTMETDESLACTERGQVAEGKARTVFSFTAEKAEALQATRQVPQGESLKNLVRETLRLPPRQGTPAYRILRPISNRRYPTRYASTYAVETEPQIMALVTRLSEQPHLSRPPEGPPQAILYVAHHSADAELREETLIRQLRQEHPGVAMFACDVRGLGDSQPDTCGVDQFLKPYGSDYFYAIHALMLDRPYVGQKTHDVLSVLDWLAGFGHTEIHLAAAGWGTLPAAFAALLSDRVRQVTLKRALRSYDDIARSESYDWPLSSFVPNVLARFDLPDVYRALETKQLRQLEPRGATVSG